MAGHRVSVTSEFTLYFTGVMSVYYSLKGVVMCREISAATTQYDKCVIYVSHASI